VKWIRAKGKPNEETYITKTVEVDPNTHTATFNDETIKLVKTSLKYNAGTQEYEEKSVL